VPQNLAQMIFQYVGPGGLLGGLLFLFTKAAANQPCWEDGACFTQSHQVDPCTSGSPDCEGGFSLGPFQFLVGGDGTFQDPWWPFLFGLIIGGFINFAVMALLKKEIWGGDKPAQMP
jgi:hypothetical protein